jgi:regulator of protease activity HflC (stomatin/prohibitin superfamily)
MPSQKLNLRVIFIYLLIFILDERLFATCPPILTITNVDIELYQWVIRPLLLLYAFYNRDTFRVEKSSLPSFYYYKSGGFMSGFGIFVLALFVFAVLLVFMSVKSVPQGMEYTVERFGKYTNTLTPGLNIIIPIIDRIGKQMIMMEQVMDVPSQEVITKDNAMVTVDGVVFYQVMDAAKAAYEVSKLDWAILNLVMTNIRTVMGSMDLDELLSRRDDINARLLRVVDDATTPWGIKATRIEIKDIAPPKDLVEAMGRQMKAERLKRASILEAEGLRQSEILRAEGAQQAAILDAEGRKEAAYRDADARERLAQAEARATLMVSEAISKGDIQAINYFVAQKYIEALQHIASAENSKLIFMPLESSSVIGALGGITELAKAAMTKKS